jgi:hypothetical protein
MFRLAAMRSFLTLLTGAHGRARSFSTMKRIRSFRRVVLRLGLVLVACWPAVLRAESEGEAQPKRTRVSLRPHLGYAYGTVGYSLSATMQDSQRNVVTAKSQLDYSVNSLMAGGDLVIRGTSSTGRLWEVGLSAATNLTQPSGSLLDRDWASAQGMTLEFSHTDSSEKGHLIHGEIWGAVGLIPENRSLGSFALDLLFGYRHESYVMDAYGVDGWQLDNNLERQPVHVDAGESLLHFTSQKFMPNGGLKLRGLWGSFFLDSSLRVAAIVSYDVDDHLLRNKKGTATSYGIGGLVGVAPGFILSGEGATGSLITLGLDLQILYQRAWGTLRQAYYGRDPGNPDLGPEDSIPNADFVAYNQIAVLRLVFNWTF